MSSCRFERFTAIPSRRSGQRRHHSARVPARFFEDPGADVEHEPGLFGHGDELVGRDEAEAGSFPSQQRLEAADQAGVGRDERLAEQAQLVARQRLAQRGLERDLGGDPELHRLVEQLVAAAPVALRAVHGDVGVRQDLLGGLGAVGGKRHADARAHVRFVGAEIEGLLQRRDDAFREVGCLVHAFDVFAQHDELVAAQARDRVGLADRLLDAGRALRRGAGRRPCGRACRSRS